MILRVGLVSLLASLLVSSAGCSADSASTNAPPVSPTATASAKPTSTLPPGVDQLVRFSIDGKRVTGPPRVKVTKGNNLRIVVTSSKADEVHVHGYDLRADVAAGGTAQINVKATISGVFEVELESSHLLITKLQVQ